MIQPLLLEPPEATNGDSPSVTVSEECVTPVAADPTIQTIPAPEEQG